MKKIQIIALGFVSIIALNINAYAATEEEKLYVAVEGEGKVAVFDTSTRKLLRQIDLSYEQHGMAMSVSPHNVQVAPDGKTVWVTANGSHGGHGGKPAVAEPSDGDGPHGMVMETPADEVLVIDPKLTRSSGAFPSVLRCIWPMWC